jgi:glutathione synthase/RimK-type ligase-like ATP-grasp enzyme
VSTALVVVDRPEDWRIGLEPVEVVSARDYITSPEYSSGRGAKVFNLCRSYRYQSLGYYVSLLAAARGHRPMPSATTIQDLKNPSLLRVVSEDLEDLIQRSLAHLASREFELSIYFGRNVAQRYHRLSVQLFNLFPAPLLRAGFARQRSRWQIQSLRPIAAKDIPENHRDFVVQVAGEQFARRRWSPARRNSPRYDLAILVNPQEREPPSDAKALQRFARAAQASGFGVEFIGPDDIGRMAEFDALFLRETTFVNRHTYRFARRAEAEGLVVIDDPQSILRCTNKVFLAEALARANVPTPRTEIIHRQSLDSAMERLGFPCVLKVPDSAFSRGVVRLDAADEFRRRALLFLEDSELVIAQEYVPTAYDWRVGVLNRKVLYVCKYHMAEGHWQIIDRDGDGKARYGAVECMALEAAPRGLLRTALRAANAIGDGLYGVDIKERDGRFLVMEVNDNPNIDWHVEDKVLGEGLYTAIMEVFRERVERRKVRR